MQLFDNNEKETFMDSFPQVDPRYGKILASRRVPLFIEKPLLKKVHIGVLTA